MGDTISPFSAWITLEKPMLGLGETDVVVVSTPVPEPEIPPEEAGDLLPNPPDALDDQGESAINDLVDSTPVLHVVGETEPPEMSAQVLMSFCVDVAQNVHTFAQIARRYGFESVGQMGEFINGNYNIRRRIKELRAVWESDDHVQERVRKLAGHTVLAALPETARIMLNPRLPDATRIDALKQHAAIAGMNAHGGHAAGGANGRSDAAKFSVNIMFAGSGRTETITATAIEHKNDEPVSPLDDRD